MLFRNEVSWSFGLNSNGLGTGFRYATHLDRLHKTIYDVQIVSLHHPKEIKINTGSGKMAYGKLNNAYALTLTIGKITEKFSKLDKGSVAISYLYDGGFALGFEKPIYYYVEYPDKIERFNTSSNPKYGKAPFIFGVDEAKIIPGIFVKSCLQFEFSKFDKEIKALEIGVNLHAYLRKINIMYSNDNAWIYPSFYINYRLGRVL